MHYNKKRHRKLLKRSQDLKNQGKNLFRENKAEELELSEYNVAIQLHFFWQDRDKVALLIENFLKQKIDGELFCDQVYEIRHKLISKCEKFNFELITTPEKIKDFKPDSRSKKLKGFLTGLYCECEYLDDTEDYKEFYHSIKNGFLNFKNAVNEE